MTKFKAYRIFNEDGQGRRPAGRDDPRRARSRAKCVIKTAYSSVNFKDALAATGAGKIIRRFPCVGGIDGCGVVESSTDPRFKEGDAGDRHLLRHRRRA